MVGLFLWMRFRGRERHDEKTRTEQDENDHQRASAQTHDENYGINGPQNQIRHQILL